MSQLKLVVRNLHKVFQVDEGFGRFSSITAIDNVNLEVSEGELVTIIGPSGCGKSTLLMILAGLYDKSSGEARQRWEPRQTPRSGHWWRWKYRRRR